MPDMIKRLFLRPTYSTGECNSIWYVAHLCAAWARILESFSSYTITKNTHSRVQTSDPVKEGVWPTLGFHGTTPRQPLSLSRHSGLRLFLFGPSTFSVHILPTKPIFYVAS